MCQLLLSQNLVKILCLGRFFVSDRYFLTLSPHPHADTDHAKMTSSFLMDGDGFFHFHDAPLLPVRAGHVPCFLRQTT